MYEAIEEQAKQFESVSNLLFEQKDAERMNALGKALEQTATRISEVAPETDTDRANLGKLYRGFLAASRILEQLRAQPTEVAP